MPGLARKILICAAVDGLIIQPLSSRGQRPFSPVRILYDDASVSNIARDQVPTSSEPDSSFEAFGVIGLVTVSRLSYLITITRRQQVAQIFGYPIYVVTEVAITPCSHKTEAENSIQNTARHLRARSHAGSGSEDGESSDEEVGRPSTSSDEVDDDVVFEGGKKHDTAKSSVAEDVIHRRGSYGRFAQRWFSRSGWTQDQKRIMGMSNSSASQPDAVVTTVPTEPERSIGESSNENVKVSDQPSNLLPKLLRTMQVLFGSSRSFYFSYDFDITRHFENKASSPRTGELFSQVEDVFFWNRNILKPFLDAGQDSLSLPIMQGFIGQRTFVVDSNPPQVDDVEKNSLELRSMSTEPKTTISSVGYSEAAKNRAERRDSEKTYLVTLISRRSVRRAGLRYLRRGIDQDGFTANTVETEQILSSPEWDDSAPIHSFLQIRGSIPLFFSQTPFSLKPAPVLQHSDEVNRQACKKHFDMLRKAYGPIQIVNLVEKHGIEASLGTRFERTVASLNSLASEPQTTEPTLSFEWFDFHRACRGMKFENVSYLLAILKEKLESNGSSTLVEGKLKKKQKGILRTNCMDCLDRTNVCQSSFAKHILDIQLAEEGIDMSAQVDQETRWFNTLWADNGDAISKQYASTSAMKGDYTRTKKRDYRGALNDLGLSLTRFYSGMVNDFFSQTAMDFLLGNVNDKVFDEFETNMMTKDPAMSMSNVRGQAIELCHKRVIADETEEYMGGWALLSPRSSDTIRSSEMEEVVLLLTDLAIYLCRFDWSMEKVASFERVHLASIKNIKLGTYITSTMSASQTDESKNFGFVLSYQPGETDIKRTNTRTLSTLDEFAANPDIDPSNDKDRPMSFTSIFSGGSKANSSRRLAFKAPYTDTSAAVIGVGPQQTEVELVTSICSEIDRLVVERLIVKGGEKTSRLEKGSIISLEEAKWNTGLLDHIGHSIKKLVWA